MMGKDGFRVLRAVEGRAPVASFHRGAQAFGFRGWSGYVLGLWRPSAIDRAMAVPTKAFAGADDVLGLTASGRIREALEGCEGGRVSIGYWSRVPADSKWRRKATRQECFRDSLVA